MRFRVADWRTTDGVVAILPPLFDLPILTVSAQMLPEQLEAVAQVLRSEPSPAVYECNSREFYGNDKMIIRRNGNQIQAFRHLTVGTPTYCMDIACPKQGRIPDNVYRAMCAALPPTSRPNLEVPDVEPVDQRNEAETPESASTSTPVAEAATIETTARPKRKKKTDSKPE